MHRSKVLEIKQGSSQLEYMTRCQYTFHNRGPQLGGCFNNIDDHCVRVFRELNETLLSDQHSKRGFNELTSHH